MSNELDRGSHPNRMIISSDPATLPEKALTGFETSIKPRGSCVYILEAVDGRIKVGRSEKPRSRAQTLSLTAGVTIARAAVSSPMVNAHIVERATHRTLSAGRLRGEWFRADFGVAVAAVEAQPWQADSAENVAAEQAERRRLDDLYPQFNPKNWVDAALRGEPRKW